MIFPQGSTFPGPYQGAPIALGSNTYPNARQTNFIINWNLGPSNNIYTFDLRQNSVYPISQILSMYVDNFDIPNSITFYFPDTGFRFVCPANSAGYFPVVTNSLTFLVELNGTYTSISTARTVVFALNIPASTIASSTDFPGQEFVVGNNGAIVPVQVSTSLSHIITSGNAASNTNFLSLTSNITKILGYSLFLQSVVNQTSGNPAMDIGFYFGLTTASSYPTILTTLYEGEFNFNASFTQEFINAIAIDQKDIQIAMPALVNSSDHPIVVTQSVSGYAHSFKATASFFYA